MVGIFKSRHDFVHDALKQIKGVRALPAQGTFYIFPNMQEAIKNLGMKNDLELGEHLIEKAGVALVPGSAFGSEGHMRISFATSMENLQKAMERLQKALG
ncbi:MAG: hypothetical protein RIS84_1282, partial [Pseudomonadota bacterium]